MRRGTWLAAIVCASATAAAAAVSCSSYSGNEGASDAGGDATTTDAPVPDASDAGSATDADANDAAATFHCASITPTPFLCADFDEPAAVVFENGIQVDIPSPDAGVTVARVASPTGSGLHITTAGPQYRIEFAPSAPTNVTKVAGVVVLRFATIPAVITFPLLYVGLTTGGTDSCFVELAIESGPKLMLESNCQGQPKYITLLPTLPTSTEWVGFQYGIDFGAGVAKVSTNGATPIELDFGGADGGGAPNVLFGAVSDTAVGTVDVAFDDVLVGVEP